MTMTNTPSKPATGRRRYDPKPVPADNPAEQPEAADPAEPVLTGMAAQAAAFQAANPDLKLVLIPLRDGGTPKLEGKVPIPDNWEQSEGVPFDHPSWRKATGYGLVLTGNQEVVIFDIDGKLSKKSPQSVRPSSRTALQNEARISSDMPQTRNRQTCVNELYEKLRRTMGTNISLGGTASSPNRLQKQTSPRRRQPDNPLRPVPNYQNGYRHFASPKNRGHRTNKQQQQRQEGFQA